MLHISLRYIFVRYTKDYKIYIMAKTTKTPYSLLGILSVAPSTGYDIKKFIEASICNFWSESFGQIYPMLSKLVKDGYATKNTQNQKGKPKKIIYRITNKGLETLQAWLREPAICMPHPRNEFLLKMFFGRHLSLKENISHIELLLQFVSEKVHELDTKEKF